AGVDGLEPAPGPHLQAHLRGPRGRPGRHPEVGAGERRRPRLAADPGGRPSARREVPPPTRPDEGRNRRADHVRAGRPGDEGHLARRGGLHQQLPRPLLRPDGGVRPHQAVRREPRQPQGALRGAPAPPRLLTLTCRPGPGRADPRAAAVVVAPPEPPGPRPAPSPAPAGTWPPPARGRTRRTRGTTGTPPPSPPPPSTPARNPAATRCCARGTSATAPTR